MNENKWISVKDRLPTAEEMKKYDGRFLVGACSVVMEARYGLLHWESLSGCLLAPTHWRPLPDPPTEHQMSEHEKWWYQKGQMLELGFVATRAAWEAAIASVKGERLPVRMGAFEQWWNTLIPIAGSDHRRMDGIPSLNPRHARLIWDSAIASTKSS